MRLQRPRRSGGWATPSSEVAVVRSRVVTAETGKGWAACVYDDCGRSVAPAVVASIVCICRSRLIDRLRKTIILLLWKPPRQKLAGCCLLIGDARVPLRRGVYRRETRPRTGGQSFGFDWSHWSRRTTSYDNNIVRLLLTDFVRLARSNLNTAITQCMPRVNGNYYAITVITHVSFDIQTTALGEGSPRRTTRSSARVVRW